MAWVEIESFGVFQQGNESACEVWIWKPCIPCIGSLTENTSRRYAGIFHKHSSGHHEKHIVHNSEETEIMTSNIGKAKYPKNSPLGCDMVLP